MHACNLFLECVTVNIITLFLSDYSEEFIRVNQQRSKNCILKMLLLNVLNLCFHMYPAQLHFMDQQADTKQIQDKPQDALCGHYPDGEYSKPELRDLMCEIGQRVAKHWHDIGIQLGLEYEELQDIESNHKETRRQITEVFNLWKLQGGTNNVEPYKWKSILDILEFRLLLSNLAKDIRRKLEPVSLELVHR